MKIQRTYDLSGYAPIEVAYVSVNSNLLAATWTSTTQWVGTVSLTIGTNVFNVDGRDINFQKLPAYGQEYYTNTAVIIRN